MPSDMRLQCPSEDTTPPSTRPPSVASSATSGTPHRSTSMDSLHTNSSTSDSNNKPTGEEFIPTRLVRAIPKANANAMQFVKTGPALLHKSAKEQMKKAEVVKSLRKSSLQEAEEEEWQTRKHLHPSSSSDTSNNNNNIKNRNGDDDQDWQSNLDKWKSNRRKRNEGVLERVIEVKRNEQLQHQDDHFSQQGRRRSKTFNEMREEKNRRGRRYNLVVHDDDNNDLSDLGLSTTSPKTSDPPEEGEAKSDAGFCTGSDTGSDGVFAEDNISDTSSALGDKREIHDSLLDSSKDTASDVIINGHHLNEDAGGVLVSAPSEANSPLKSRSSGLGRVVDNGEYTYDKAIEGYKQFAENSVKKRTSSVNSLSSNTSKEDPPFDKGVGKSEDKTPSSYFDDTVVDSSSDSTMKTDSPRGVVVVRRERSAAAKVDIDKRRSMFELRDIDRQETKYRSSNSSASDYRRSMDVSEALRNKVASFENVSTAGASENGGGTSSRPSSRGVTPLRDTKFKEKLANFTQIERGGETVGVISPSPPRGKKTPEKDQNFYQKLQNFTQIEARSSSGSLPRNISPSEVTGSKTTLSKRLSMDRVYDRRGGTPAPTPLKDRIASFENLSPSGSSGTAVSGSGSKKELSVSMENLSKGGTSVRGTGGLGVTSSQVLQTSQSATNLFRRAPSTPFMVVEVDEEELSTTTTQQQTSEETCVKSSVTREYDIKTNLESLESRERASSSLLDKSLEGPPLSAGESTSIPDSNGSKVLPDTPVSKPPVGNVEDLFNFRPEIESHKPRILPEIPVKNRPEGRSLPEPTSPKSMPDFSRPRALPETPVTGVGRREGTPRFLPEIPTSRELSPSPAGRDSALLTFEESPVPKEGILVNLVSLEPSSESLKPPTECPPVPPPRVPTFEEPYSEKNEDGKNRFYGDQDIDEVIGNTPSLSQYSKPEMEHPAVGEGASTNAQDLSRVKQKDLVQEKNAKNSFISEKMAERSDVVTEKEANSSLKAPTPKKNLSPTPPLPPKNANNLSVFEVLDVTWTEDKSSSPALPPSVPPPPPPPEEEEEEEEIDEPVGGGGSTGGNPQASNIPTPSATEYEHTQRQHTSSPQSTKQELRKRMSDFLGTQPKTEEAVKIEPPPDLSELLRQEREAERQLLLKQQEQQQQQQRQISLSKESRIMETTMSSGSVSPVRAKYTWKDRMKADDPKPLKDDLDESSDPLEFHSHKPNFSSVHASDTYRNYVSNFSHSTFLVNNTHNGSQRQTFVTDTLKSHPLQKYSSCEKLPNLSKPRSSFSESYDEKSFLDSSYKMKSVSTSNLYERESTIPDNHQERATGSKYLKEPYTPYKSYSGYSSPLIRKASSYGNLNENYSSLTKNDRCNRSTTDLRQIPSRPLGQITQNKMSSSLYKSLSSVPLKPLPPKPLKKPTKIGSDRIYSQSPLKPIKAINIDKVQDTGGQSRLLPLPPTNLNRNFSKSSSHLTSPLEEPKNYRMQYVLKKPPTGRLNSETYSSKYVSTLNKPLSLSESNLSKLPDVPSTLPEIFDSSDINDVERLRGNREPLRNYRYSLNTLPDPPSNFPRSLSSFSNPNSNISSPVLPETMSALLDTITVLLDSKSDTKEFNHTFTNTHTPYESDYTFPPPPLHVKTEVQNRTARPTVERFPSSLAYKEESSKFKKLAELEQEMEKHDRDMLQRIKPSPAEGNEYLGKGPLPETPPPSVYSDPLDSEVEKRMSDFTLSQEYNLNSYPIRKAGSVSSMVSPTTHLPYQDFSNVPPLMKAESFDSNHNARMRTQERSTNDYDPTLRDTKKMDRDDEPPKTSPPQVPPPVPRKQSILALSAIPKPKLTDNDSWIMKRKAEATKRDYSKHWLIQEAEQRRLEQRERISRPAQLPLNKQPSSPLHTTAGYHSHFQSLKSSFHATTTTTTTSHSHSPTTGLNPSLMPNRNGTTYSHSDSSNKQNFNIGPFNGSNTSLNNNWMKQTKTYQPNQQPSPTSSSKPLPDAIINTLTQRVNNRINGNSSRPAVYSSVNAAGSNANITNGTSSTYRVDDTHHDYMNTDSLASPHNNLPSSNGLPGTGSAITPSTGVNPLQGSVPSPSGSSQGLLSEEQRLLSVSGKKKCSHCGEELGRGAAMIIESLRLFYHIPCFKCCVCGIQLGNGTSGADVRVRNHKLHCHNCYSNDEGMKFSKV